MSDNTMNIDELTVSDRDLAQLIGVSDRRIRAMAEAGILEKHGRGKYLLGPAIRAMLNNAADNASELQRERTRKMAADADLAELEYAKRKNLVVSVEQVERNLSGLFAQVQTNIRNVPDRVVSSLIGMTDERKFKTILLREIDLVLTALAESEVLIDEAYPEDG